MGTQLNSTEKLNGISWKLIKSPHQCNPCSLSCSLILGKELKKAQIAEYFAQLVVLVFKIGFITSHLIGLTSMLSALLRQQCGDRSLYMGVCSVSVFFFSSIYIYIYTVACQLNWLAYTRFRAVIFWHAFAWWNYIFDFFYYYLFAMCVVNFFVSASCSFLPAIRGVFSVFNANASIWMVITIVAIIYPHQQPLIWLGVIFHCAFHRLYES